MTKTANRNMLWAEIFVDELARNGLRAVCITPGSRSTPLTLAFAADPRITVYSHIDERSAAFFALGMALASGEPAALLCTSGTAAAEFYPAIVEANYAEVPLLILTADRPHELRESGSNQTIDQVRLYGDHVRLFVDVAPPEAVPDPGVLRYLRALAARALSTTVSPCPGPVHLNFPFRKPLEPTSVPGDVPESLGRDFPLEMQGRAEGQPFTRITRGEIIPTASQIETLAQTLEDAPHGLIVCGPRCPGGDFPAAVTRLARISGYPILADGLSGVRFGPHISGADGLILGGYETFLQSRSAADCAPLQIILRFGAMPTSQALIAYVGRQANARHILVTSTGRWADENHRLSDLICADPEVTCRLLADRLGKSARIVPDPEWAKAFQQMEALTWEVVAAELASEPREGAILAGVVDRLPSGASLFVASSLPVRHLDQFARPSSKDLRVFSNRGASGIDGTLASALGVAAVTDGPLALVIGDLALYHDMNSLLALKRCNLNATIVVINNDGGGIFHRLPIAQFDPPFTDLVLTPHGLTFESAARTFGVDYRMAESQRELVGFFEESVSANRSTLIEAPSDSADFERRRREIVAAVSERLAELTEAAPQHP